MESLTITRPVVVKVRVTEEYKKALSTEIQEAISRLDLQIQHAGFQIKRMLAETEKQNPEDIPAARQRLEGEQKRRLEARQQLMEKLKETGKLVPGEEVIHGRLESIVELRIGYDWQSIMNVEVILENGKVIEIRQ